MRPGLGFLAAALLYASPLAAQAFVVPRERPVEPDVAAARDALFQFRDSLGAVNAAVARLQRDTESASPQVLLVRARSMRTACEAALRNLPATRDAVAGAKAGSTPRQKHKDELLRAFDPLKRALTRCQRQFEEMSTVGKGETVRGYGNDRAAKVQRDLLTYDRSVEAFLRAFGIRDRAAGPPQLGSGR